MRTESFPKSTASTPGAAARLTRCLAPVLLTITLTACNALVKAPPGRKTLHDDPPAALSGLERLRFAIENLGEVEPGLLYRSANPSRTLLKFLVKRVGLKYVLNLRGTANPEDAAFMKSIGGELISLPMSASRPPTPRQVLEMIRITQQARREGASILIHCMAGADRTGMMVGAWRMLFQGARDRETLTRETLMYRHIPPAWPNVHRYIAVFRPELFRDFIDNPPLLLDESRILGLEKNFLLDYPLLAGNRALTRGPLRAGPARMDLLEGWSDPVQMASYGPSPPRARGVRQPVYARALVLDNGATRLALVSCDLLIMHRGLREAVLGKLSGSGSRFDGVMLSATHTHTSVGGFVDDPLFEFYMLGEYDPEWADHLAARIAGAISKADSSLQDARLGCGRTFVEDANYNRRHGETTDPELALIKITGPAGKPLALLVNFAGHPILEPNDAMLSPDYPGLLAAKLDTDYGFGFFLQGALGDLNAGFDRRDPEWRREELAEKIAGRLHRAIAGVYDSIPVEAEIRLASLTASFKLPDINFNLVPDLLFPIDWLFNSLIDWPERFPLQGVRIGDAAILATSSELSGRLGLQVKRNSPVPFTLVASHCGDYAGYALAQAYHARSKLDASSIVALGGSSHGPHLIESSAALLDALWDGEEKARTGPPLSPAALHRISWPDRELGQEERKQLLQEASTAEEVALGLSLDPTLPQSRSFQTLVGNSIRESLRIDVYTAWHDRVRGASRARGDLQDSGARLSAEIPGDLRLDLQLGYRSASWELDGARHRKEDALDLKLGVEKIFTLNSDRLEGNALRLIPRLEFQAPSADASDDEPFAFASGSGVWRPGAGGAIEFTWNTARTLSAQTLYTTTLDDHLGRRPGDRWESLLGYSERHGCVSLHLRAGATLWLADRRDGGLTAADLAARSWELALRPGLSLHLGNDTELFFEGSFPLGHGDDSAGDGSGLFIGLSTGF